MLIDSHNYIPVCNICIFWQITQCMAIGLKIKITAVAFWDAMVGMNLQDVMLSDTFAGQRNGTAIFLLVKKVRTWTSYTQIHPCHRNKGSRCIQDLKTYLFTTVLKCPFKLQFFLLKKKPLPIQGMASLPSIYESDKFLFDRRAPFWWSNDWNIVSCW